MEMFKKKKNSYPQPFIRPVSPVSDRVRQKNRLLLILLVQLDKTTPVTFKYFSDSKTQMYIFQFGQN